MANIFTNTPDYTNQCLRQDITDNRVMGILAYCSWLVLVPLFAAKGSKFARHHVNQGLILAIAEVALWVVFGLLSRIPYIGWLFAIIEWAGTVACTGLSVLGIVNAARGFARELPFIGFLRIIK